MFVQLIQEMLTLIGGLIVVYFVYVLFAKKYDKPSRDSPSMAHMALQELVERAVEEARKLPGLGGSCEVTEQPADQEKRRSIKEHDYEDLLATAILNKVIQKFQDEKVDNNSNILDGIRAKSILNENEFGVEDGLDECSSSLEPLSQDDCSSDCSLSRSKYFRSHREPLSLTIEEQIEEVTTTYTSDEEFPNENNQLLNIGRSRRVPFPEFGMDIVDPSQESTDEESGDESNSQPTRMMDLITPSESWEENWLFQRKKTGVKADSVAMLVPHPSAEFKAMIGDKDAEDTSDLSECSAQSDEEMEKELIEVIQNVVPRVSNEGNSIFEQDLFLAKEETKIPEAESPRLEETNDERAGSEDVDRCRSDGSRSKNSVLDEVEENGCGQYRAVPMYVYSNDEENGMDKSIGSLEKFIISERQETFKGISISHSIPKTNSDLNLLSAPPRPGTIAEREHKKWENAAPIENNPYSEQSIQKRLLERQYTRRSSDIPSAHSEPVKNTEPNEVGDIGLESNKPDIRRFSRDYYINNNTAKLSSGIERNPQRATQSVSSSSCSSISRPSSSLSQESISDVERQVSYDLESFEETYLRDSPSRRNRCRDPRVSSQFAINPLLRHDVATNASDLDESCQIEDSFRTNPFKNVIINPIYDEDASIVPSEQIKTIDDDSGLYSIESSINENPISDRTTWVNGKKYFNEINGWRYHTFGGIKRKSRHDLDDDCEGNDDHKDSDVFEEAIDFARLKFQTFGGIKRTKLPVYRKIKLGASIDGLKNNEGRHFFYDRDSEVDEDWQDEDDGNAIFKRKSKSASTIKNKFHGVRVGKIKSNSRDKNLLEPAVVADIVQRDRNFKYLRKRDRKKKSDSSKTSFSGVRNLSNITIW